MVKDTAPDWVGRPPAVGDRVRIERDEARYPSKGTWPQFRGRTGTVVEINIDRKRPHLTEYGVIFGKAAPRTDGRGGFHWPGTEPITWFKAYEARVLTRGEASERHAEPRFVRPERTVHLESCNTVYVLPARTAEAGCPA